jgi:hypothetical protein
LRWLQAVQNPVHICCSPISSIIPLFSFHLHRAIPPLLWDKIEEARSDCTFIYGDSPRPYSCAPEQAWRSLTGLLAYREFDVSEGKIVQRFPRVGKLNFWRRCQGPRGVHLGKIG